MGRDVGVVRRRCVDPSFHLSSRTQSLRHTAVPHIPRRPDAMEYHTSHTHTYNDGEGLAQEGWLIGNSSFTGVCKVK